MNIYLLIFSIEFWRGMPDSMLRMTETALSFGARAAVQRANLGSAVTAKRWFKP